MVTSPKFIFNIILKITNYFLNTVKLKSLANIPEEENYSFKFSWTNHPNNAAINLKVSPSYQDLCVDLFYDPQREAHTPKDAQLHKEHLKLFFLSLKSVHELSPFLLLASWNVWEERGLQTDVGHWRLLHGNKRTKIHLLLHIPGIIHNWIKQVEWLNDLMDLLCASLINIQA